MSQLSFIQSKPSGSSGISKSAEIEMYIDGASRSNPGPSGVGIFIKTKESKTNLSYFLNNKTNNQAEYYALVLGLMHIGQGSIKIFSDSELLVKQIKGEYKVKNQGLKDLFLCAKKLLEHFDYKISHVLRDKNKEADKLANIAIDKKVELPNEIKKQLLEHNIPI